MSNIPAARWALHDALAYLEKGDDVRLRECIYWALSNMTRSPCVRRAPGQRVIIDKKTRAHIKRLAKDPNLTMQTIASLTGVRSAGRVSEVLNGRR